MKTFEVQVTQIVKVSLDESLFTPEFMEEFRKSMYPFHTLQDHAEHLAQLIARGVIESGNFIDGYGKGVGELASISIEVTHCDEMATE